MSIPTYQSYTKTNASSSTSVNATKPSGLSEGDLMVAFFISNRETHTSGASFTSIDTITTSALSFYISTWYKIATTGDVAASTFNFGHSSSGSLCVFLMRISNPKSSPIGQHSISGGTSTATLTNSGFTPSQTNSMYLLMGLGYKDSDASTYSGYAFATSSPTFTEIFDTTAIVIYDTACCAYTSPRPQITATGNATITASSSRTTYAISLIEILVNPTTQTLSDSIVMSESLLQTTKTTHSDNMLLSDSLESNTKKVFNTQKSSSTWSNEPKS